MIWRIRKIFHPAYLAQIESFMKLPIYLDHILLFTCCMCLVPVMNHDTGTCCSCWCEWEWRETPNWLQFQAALVVALLGANEGKEKHQTGSKPRLLSRQWRCSPIGSNLRTDMRIRNAAWNDIGGLEQIQRFLMQLGTIQWNLKSIPEVADPIPKLWNWSLHSWTSCNVVEWRMGELLWLIGEWNRSVFCHL